MIKVPGYGNPNAKILIVGEAPGADEERQGQPFVGKAGEALRRSLMGVGIDPADCWFTNVCKYRPPQNQMEQFFLDGGFPNELVMMGILELKEEIELVRPNVIYAAGNYPLWALCPELVKWQDKMVKGKRVRGFTGITHWRGSILESTLVPGMKVIPSYHPSYIIREGMSDHGIWGMDLAKIAEDSQFPELRWPEKKIVFVSEQPQVLENYHDVIRGNSPVWRPDSSRITVRERLLDSPSVPTTLDIEYIGSKLLCVGLTNNRDEAYVVPTATLGDTLYAQGIINETKSFNAQNAMFDASILEWHYGLKIMKRVVYDTMLAANAAYIELPKGLDFLVSVYTRQPNHKGMVDWRRITKGQQDLSMMYVYNGIDVWSQHEIMEEQQRWEFDDPAVPRTFQFMMQMLEPLWEMSKRGVRMDLEMIRNISTILDGEAAQTMFELMILTNSLEPVNLRSNKQVAALLFDRLGATPSKLNATGPACDDKSLATISLKTKDPLVRQVIQLIRNYRTAENLKSKFFDIEFDTDGRMRGSYDPTKTVTGRLASRKFHPTGKGTNAQNIPRDKRARRAFIADRGKIFGYADLERAESLVVAHLTGDPRMLHDHAPGQNAHRNLGEALFGIPAAELDEIQYYLSKKTRHAGNYMEGGRTLMNSINQEGHKTGIFVTEAEGKKFIAQYKSLHPALERWWGDLNREVHNGRTLYNLLGRKRTFYGHLDSSMPEIVAFKPQSTVGDTLNIGFLNTEGKDCPYTIERGIFDPLIAEELREYGYSNLMQIHDALGFQCNERDVEKVGPVLRRAMSVPLMNPRTLEDFTIPVEIAVDVDPDHIKNWTSNWGDVKVQKVLSHA